MNLSKSALIILSVISISACGGGSGGSNTGARNVSPEEALFEGTWESCNNDESVIITEDQNSELFRTTMEKGEYYDVYIGYSGADCSGDKLYTEEYEGEYDVLQTVVADSGVQAIEVNWINDDGEIYCYDLVHFDGDRFYFGDSNTGFCDTPELRPTDIYFDYFMVQVDD